MSDVRHLDDLLRSLDGDAGCTAGEAILDAYVDLELAGEDPATAFPGTAIHLAAAPAAARITTVFWKRPASSATLGPS